MRTNILQSFASQNIIFSTYFHFFFYLYSFIFVHLFLSLPLTIRVFCSSIIIFILVSFSLFIGPRERHVSFSLTYVTFEAHSTPFELKDERSENNSKKLDYNILEGFFTDFSATIFFIFCFTLLFLMLLFLSFLLILKTNTSEVTDLETE